MLLQEIFKDEYKDKKEASGITLNEESSQIEYHTPPENFESLGLVLKLDNDGLISDDLLDIIINYKITNIDILIEVPSQFLKEGTVDAKYLIQLASNVDFMISILPPGHPLVGDAVTVEEYAIIIEDFTKELITKTHFDKMIFPISNFMEYLMLETLLGADAPQIKEFKPTNEYIIDNFSTVLNHDSSNLFKDKIRNVLYDFYEGKENFELVASLMFKNIENKSHEIFTNYVNEYIQNNPQSGEQQESK